MTLNTSIVLFVAHIYWKLKCDGNNSMDFTAGLLRSCGNEEVMQENGTGVV